jgi:hypothetical protein
MSPVDEILMNHQHSIVLFYHQRPILDILNIQINESVREVRQPVGEVYNRIMVTQIKINCSPGFILCHRISGHLRYYHSSINNHTILDRAIIVNVIADLDRFLDDLIKQDFLKFVFRQCPNTSWVVHKLINVTVYLYKMLNVEGTVPSSIFHLLFGTTGSFFCCIKITELKNHTQVPVFVTSSIM